MNPRSPRVAGTALCFVFGVAATASAQTFHSTLPDGLMTDGGSWSSGNGVAYVFDRGVFHYQEVHTSWNGSGAKLLIGAGFRRAWNRATTTTAVARTADFTFTVGYGNLATFANASFAGNFTPNSAVIVHPTGQINMPSWVNMPPAAPAPFDVVVPFKQPFPYDGKTDFVWELDYTNPSVTTTTTYYCDRQSSTTSTVRNSTAVGTGCTATGQAAAHGLTSTFTNFGPTATPNPMQWDLTATNNPNSQAVTLAIGVQALNAPVPGWCAPVHPSPLLYLPMGMSSASGTLAPQSLGLPHAAAAIGLDLYTQAFAADPGHGSGLSLSNGASFRVPGNPTPLSWKYIYQLGTSTTRSGPFTAGSVITGWY